MKGKPFVILFYGILGVMAISTIAIAGKVASGTPDERSQRELARALPNMYQKYFIDTGEWPTSAKEAAINFRSENVTFVSRVEEAETKWGMKAQLSDGDKPTANLHVTFDKPQKQDLEFVVERKEMSKQRDAAHPSSGSGPL